MWELFAVFELNYSYVHRFRSLDDIVSSLIKFNHVCSTYFVCTHIQLLKKEGCPAPSVPALGEPRKVFPRLEAVLLRPRRPTRSPFPVGSLDIALVTSLDRVSVGITQKRGVLWVSDRPTGQLSSQGVTFFYRRRIPLSNLQ